MGYRGVSGSSFIDADDYQGPVSDVRPAADPNIVSDTQRMQQALAVLTLAKETPGMSMYDAQKMYLKAMKVSNIDTILPDPKGPNAIKPGPSEKIQIEQMKMQLKQAQLEMHTKLAVMKMAKDMEINQAKIHKLEADALLAIEQAGGIKVGHEIALFDAQIGAAKAKQEGMQSAMKTIMELEKHLNDMSQESKQSALPSPDAKEE